MNTFFTGRRPCRRRRICVRSLFSLREMQWVQYLWIQYHLKRKDVRLIYPRVLLDPWPKREVWVLLHSSCFIWLPSLGINKQHETIFAGNKPRYVIINYGEK